MISGILATILMQPAGIFPFAAPRIRPDGTQDVVFVKDSRDKGTVLGKGSNVTQIPRQGGCVFASNELVPTVLAFDAGGQKLSEFARFGFKSVGRPAVVPSGNYAIAEFVGEFESEIWRFPLKGKGPATMISSINKGDGTANPAFEMDGRSTWVQMGGSWNLLNLSTSITERIDVKPLFDGLPSGSIVTEVRPSHSIPKLVAVTVLLPGKEKLKWVMVWDRQTDRVSRLNPVGTSAESADWNRDGRFVIFNATDTKSGRKTLQSANPSGGEPEVISVIKDAGQ
ncbi:MAG: hypothetical protein ACKVQS_00020 [Fimbriimonadaceae bacterium]